MSRFLLLSHDGAGLPLSYRLQEEGHEVTVWIQQATHRQQYEGLLEKVADWRPEVTEDTIVLFDSVAVGIEENDKPEDEEDWSTYISIGDELRERGIRTIGGSSIADRLELDRTFGAEVAEDAGLVVPTATKFEDFEDALEFVRQTKQRYILKPHGNQATFHLYPSEDWKDMVAMLEHFQETFPPGPFELQEFVEGQQMSIEGWWTGETFLNQNSTFEHKPMLSEDLGPFTGETGSLVFYYPEGKPTKLQQDVLLKMAPVLKRLNYAPGPLDCNLILNEDGAHFLEFTARFGYPALYLQLYTSHEWGETLEGLATGELEMFYTAKDKWFLGSRVWIPKWPYGETEKTLIDAPLFERVKPSHLPHISFVDVKRKEGKLVSAGTDGELMCVTVGGESIKEAQGKLYALLHDLYLYPMGWRSDLGTTALDNLPNLKRWGYWIPAER